MCMIHIWWKNVLLFCGGLLTVLIVLAGTLMVVRMQVFVREDKKMDADERVVQNINNDRKELMLGSVGSDVREVQDRLIERGIAPENVFENEEYFGEKMQYYVILFQLTYDLVPTGIVDQNSWHVLNDEINMRTVSYQYIPLDPGYDNSTYYYSQYSAKNVHLTFNVNSNADHAARVMDILSKHNAHATFFFAQNVVSENPQIVKKAFDAGHGIGVLLRDEWNFAENTYQEISTDLLTESKNIAMITGRTPWCARPTQSMLMSAAQTKLLQQPLRMMYWDVDPQDLFVTTDVMVQHILSYTQPGEVVLFHIDEATQVEQQSVVLIRILNALKKEGWQFFPLSCM